MKILHIGDQAGVACILSKYQRKGGHESSVLISGNNDKYGIHNFYREGVVQIPEHEYLASCTKIATKADIIHVHSRTDIVVALREQFGASKKILIHFHGTDLRGLRKFDLPHKSLPSDLLIMAKLMKRKACRYLTWGHTLAKIVKLADQIIVATPDLRGYVPTSSIYLPNPVDRDHFRPLRGESDNNINKSSIALTIKSEAVDIQRTLQDCSKLGMPLEIYDRTKFPLKYADMPTYLNGFKRYVDLRYVNGRLLENLSKTALEALSCGLEVVDYQFRIRSCLPLQHEPSNVLSALDDIYARVLCYGQSGDRADEPICVGKVAK